jgi:hypothetical protein
MATIGRTRDMTRGQLLAIAPSYGLDPGSKVVEADGALLRPINSNTR